MNKAFFFDRDGVINVRKMDDYVMSVQEMQLFPEIPVILKILKENNFLTFVVTNQQGVGKGLMSENELLDIHNFMQDTLEVQCGFKFDDIEYCTDLKESASFRRKPNPGMILELAEKWNIDLKNSYIIGDTESDIIAGEKAGLKTILLSVEKIKTVPDFCISNHVELIKIINHIVGAQI